MKMAWDVYKRQKKYITYCVSIPSSGLEKVSLFNANNICKTPEIILETKNSLKYDVLTNNSNAVSYTHLDVYKRQCWRRPRGGRRAADRRWNLLWWWDRSAKKHRESRGDKDFAPRLSWNLAECTKIKKPIIDNPHNGEMSRKVVKIITK